MDKGHNKSILKLSLMRLYCDTFNLNSAASFRELSLEHVFIERNLQLQYKRAFVDFLENIQVQSKNLWRFIMTYFLESHASRTYRFIFDNETL